ncbi:glycine N-methyltransferase-like [Schistocerca americana]|uniref:glycine N-methyltransferase-like n=1 Tax=Schistocerca americana TaxID=7009 RepID=UPI001F4FE7F5|nr:glycine N-methyltransferase-like [Schistocerca americana]
MGDIMERMAAEYGTGVSVLNVENINSAKMDNVFHMRSAGAAAEGVQDQYADGRAARVWEAFIGDKNSRTQNYRNFLVRLLRKNGCQRILDVACGTGKALENFKKCVKRGGLLLIDHRNYDDILETGKTLKHCLYYNSKGTTEIVTSMLYVEAKPTVVTLDYLLDMSDKKEKNVQNGVTPDDTIARFRLSYYLHRLEVFKRMLQDVFGTKSEHTLYGDFKQLHEIDNPAFYIHVVQKAFI